MNVRRIAGAVVGLALLGGVVGTTTEAQAAYGKTVHVCAVEVPKSWTKGLSKKANAEFKQRVRVHRVTEYTLADQPCDLFLWTTENRNQVGLSPEDASFERIITATTKRPAAVVKGLRAAGVR